MSHDFDKIYITEKPKTKEEMIDAIYKIENKNSLYDHGLRNKFLLFHHINRTGGANINDVLFRMQDRGGIPLIILGMEQALSDTPPWLNIPPPLIITSHHTFGIHRKIEEDYSYFGLLRDPYKHFLSKILLWDDYKTECNHMGTIWKKLDHKVDEIRERIGHCNFLTHEHATYFADKRFPALVVDNLEGTNPNELYSKAIKNIHELFFFMGITELFEESLFILFDMIGIKSTLMWRPGLYTYWRPSKDEMPMPIFNKISSLIEADLEMYYKYRGHLESLLSKADFGEELIRYKQHARSPYNRLYTELSERFYVAANTYGPFSAMVEKEFSHSQALIGNISNIADDFRRSRALHAQNTANETCARIAVYGPLNF